MCIQTGQSNRFSILALRKILAQRLCLLFRRCQVNEISRAYNFSKLQGNPGIQIVVIKFCAYLVTALAIVSNVTIVISPVRNSALRIYGQRSYLIICLTEFKTHNCLKVGLFNRQIRQPKCLVFVFFKHNKFFYLQQELNSDHQSRGQAC